MEQNQPMVTKRIWSMARIVYFMVRKGISKSKLMLNLKYMMTKRGKIAGKALGNFILHLHPHHHHNTGATSTSPPHDLPFEINPDDFEFSCSNSPASFHLGKHQVAMTDDDVAMVNAIEVALETMSNTEGSVQASPAFPGFGRTPLARQLRITDSPFPLRGSTNHGDDDCHVDKAAEDFINRFYKQLKLQTTD